MENTFEKPRGLISRISTLLNNDVCSDVIFHVIHNEEKRRFYAHSAILITAGNGFQYLEKQTSQAKVIKVTDFSPYIVEMMLRYLYTDELNLLSMENAVNLLKLASMYEIDDLEKLCSNYITKEEVNIDNLFVKYESALSFKFPELLEKCRHLVQLETKAVFASRYFGEAPICVVEDIFSLNHMNVSNELDVIKAAICWAEFECRRKRKSTEKENVKVAITPLLKHLRFLSLSVEQFSDWTPNPDNFLNTYECVAITRKSLGDHRGPFPEHLCLISKARQPYRGIINHMVKSDDYCSETLNENTFKYINTSYSSARDSSILDPYTELGSFKDSYAAPMTKNASQRFQSDTYNKSTAKNLYSELDNKNSFKAPQSEQFVSFPEPINRNNLNEPLSEHYLGEVNSLKYGREDPLFYYQSQDKTASALTKTEQKSIYPYNQKKSTPLLKVIPQQTIPPTVRQEFDFQLQEMQNNFRFASREDIKCNVIIQVPTGTMNIYGINLKIEEQRSIPDESFEVFSCISNNYSSENETFNLKLKNSTLSLLYQKPILVTPNNPVDIEITIEDLILNRCFVCPRQIMELNCGLNAKAEISVKSTKYNTQDIPLYLISGMFYSMAP